MDNSLGEAILAVVGIDAVIEPGKLKITAAQKNEALRLAKDIRAELKRFLLGESWDRQSPLPDFDYERALDRLTGDMSLEATTDNLSGFDDDNAALAFSQAAQNAIQYLQSILPKRSRDTSTGPVSVKPSDQQVSRFRRAHSIVERPMLAFAELNEGILCKDQVTAFGAVYPAIYDYVQRAVILVMSEIKGSRPKWELPHKRDLQLQVLLGTSTFNKALASALQKAFSSDGAKMDTGEPAAPTGKPLDMSDAKPTNVERISTS